MSGCNCRSEDPWECESLRWGQPATVKDTACLCSCHTDEDEGDGAEEWMSHKDDGPVPGCNCHDCLE